MLSAPHIIRFPCRSLLQIHREKGKGENHFTMYPYFNSGELVPRYVYRRHGDRGNKDIFLEGKVHNFGVRPVFENRLRCLLANFLTHVKCEFSHLQNRTTRGVMITTTIYGEFLMGHIVNVLHILSHEVSSQSSNVITIISIFVVLPGSVI